MKRKKRKEPKRPRVVRQIHEKMIVGKEVRPTPTDVPPGAVPIGRMNTVWQAVPNDPRRIVSALNFKQSFCFCDATLFLSRTDQKIWGALLLHKRIALIPPILDELQHWLGDSNDINPLARKYVRARLDGDRSSPVRLIPAPESEELLNVIRYYVALLGIRKDGMAIARTKLARELGREPSNQEVSNAVQHMGGPRAQLLGRQGIEGAIEAHKYNDEKLVAAAFVYAIDTGREVTILTSDEAVLDQYFKMACLLTWHFVAMYLADRYLQDPTALADKMDTNSELGAYAKEGLTIIRKPSTLALEFLPPRWAAIQVHCMLLRDPVTRVTFCGDLGMRRLLAVKGATGGLNTDKLGGRNCHAYLTEAGRAKLGDKAIVAEDVSAPIAGTNMKIAVTDLDLCLTSYEQANLVVPQEMSLEVPASMPQSP